MEKALKTIILIVVGGLIVTTAYHFIGEISAVSIIGGWVFYLVITSPPIK